MPGYWTGAIAAGFIISGILTADLIINKALKGMPEMRDQALICRP
jgi:hypothetical protein